MTLYAQTMPTPAGPFSIFMGNDGIYAAGFTATLADLQQHLPSEHHSTAPQLKGDLGEVTRAVTAYFAGDLAAIDTIPLVLAGSAYFRATWAALRAIPAGTTVSYRTLAANAGNAAAIRAAASACARNPIGLFVPCHRVVRTDGTLGGYYWGLACKRWLIAHEAANRCSPHPNTALPLSHTSVAAIPAATGVTD